MEDKKGGFPRCGGGNNGFHGGNAEGFQARLLGQEYLWSRTKGGSENVEIAREGVG
jgi:hypothetical protein